MTDFTEWKTALSCKKFDGGAFDSYKRFGIELIEISPRREDYPTLDWEGIKSESKRTGVKIWSLHLPFSRDINISLPDSKKSTSKDKNDNDSQKKPSKGEEWTCTESPESGII